MIKSIGILLLTLMVIFLALSCRISPAQAHVRYILNQTEVEQASSASALAPGIEFLGIIMLSLLLVIVAIQFIGLRLADSRLGLRVEAGLLTLDVHVPLIIRVLVGAFLVFSGLSGKLFAPQLGFELSHLANPLSALQTGAGILLILGLLTKVGALLLVVLVGAAFSILGLHGLDQFVLLGVAFILFFEGGIHSSLDSLTIARLEMARRVGTALMRLKVYSMPALRLSLGVTLIWLALTEKLLAPELTEAAVLKYNLSLIHI